MPATFFRQLKYDFLLLLVDKNVYNTAIKFIM